MAAHIHAAIEAASSKHTAVHGLPGWQQNVAARHCRAGKQQHWLHLKVLQRHF
jgi:hypothetical protein